MLDYSPEDWHRVLDVNCRGLEYREGERSCADPRRGWAGDHHRVWDGAGDRGRLRRVCRGQGGCLRADPGPAAELREPDIAVNELIPGPARTPGMGGGGEHDREIEQRWWDLGEWFTDPERSRGSRLSSPPCLRGGRPARCSALLGGSCNRLGPGLCDLLLEPPGEPSL